MTKSSLTQRIETTILNNLIFNEDYTRKVIPFLKPEYFTDFTEKTVFKTIAEYVDKYKSVPDVEALNIDIQKAPQTEEQYKTIQEYLTHFVPSKVDEQWLLDETEKFCKDKAIYNAILDGIHIIDGKSKDKTADAIPAILSDALAVSFDSHVGHD